MKLFHRLLLVSFTTTMALQGLAQTNPLHAYLPSDARVVINVSLPSLASKMSWQDIQKFSFFEETLKEVPLGAQEFLKDPATTGVDFKSDLYLVLTGDPKDKSKSGGQLYGSIADPAKFAATIQQVAPKLEIKKAGNLSMLVDKKNVIAWTSQVFVIPFPPKETASSKNTGKTSDAKLQAAKAKQWLTKCQALLTPAMHPLSGDQRFMELTTQPGDIRLWVNRGTEISKPKGKKSDEILNMMNLGMLQQGNQMAGVLRFEEGKAVLQMKNYLNKTMDSLYRLYPPLKLNNNVFQKFPGGQPVVLLSFSLSPQMLGAIIKATGAQKTIDSLTKKSAVNPVDLLSGLNGDITLAVIRAHEFGEKDTVTAALNGIQIFLAASVKDKSKIQPFIDHLQKPKEKKDDEAGMTKSKNPFGGMKPSLLLNDNYFIVSVSQVAAEKFLQSAGDNEIASLAAPYASNSSLFVLDLKTIIGFAMQMSKKKSGGDEAMAQVQKTFDKIVFYGGKYENGAMMNSGELHFINKQENGLRQFMSLLELVAEMEKNKKKSRSLIEDMPANDEKK
jgi:hypothetical protein